MLKFADLSLCINCTLQSQKEVEQEQEAQLRAKYPGMKGPGTSALLQKRLSQKVCVARYLIACMLLSYINMDLLPGYLLMSKEIIVQAFS